MAQCLIRLVPLPGKAVGANEGADSHFSQRKKPEIHSRRAGHGRKIEIGISRNFACKERANLEEGPSGKDRDTRPSMRDEWNANDRGRPMFRRWQSSGPPRLWRNTSSRDPRGWRNASAREQI
ncbi:hypothetical protein PoB_003986300 [Plakobranchus ocellatus]|uniref:Uncharacterized protein n=1 Tax=Plakobranchus ocellatus TaxID=259542 RepID=A0AAV4B1C6_9GAST|nr:hypothetical protein PoB_003986300 [Plakobranchus ocellatus]